MAVAVALMAVLALPAIAGAAGPLSWSPPRPADREVPFGHWQSFTGVACPSASLCVAVGGERLMTSTSPALGAVTWVGSTLHGAESMNAISCPSVSLCVATDGNGSILSSTDPAAGASSWHRAQIEPAPSDPAEQMLFGISCPSVSLCVATDFDGRVLTSTDPSGGASAWKTITIDTSARFGGMYCPSVSLCITSDPYGILAVSTDPTGGSSAWKVFSITGGRSILGMSCPSASLCVATDSGGVVESSTDPAGGPGDWKAVSVAGGVEHALDSISCPTTTLCVAGGVDGDVAVTTDPTGPATAWHRFAVDPGNALGVDCPAAGMCIGLDQSGHALGTQNPTDGASAWTTPVPLDPPLVCGTECLPPNQQVSCPSASLCAMADAYGRGFVSTDPGEGRWTPAFDEGADAITHLDCPRAGLCVGTDDRARVLTSADPTAASPTWDAFPQAGGGRSGLVLACSRRAMCLALNINPYGTVMMLSSRHPASGAAVWHMSVVGSINLTEIDAMSCPSTSLCVAATYFRGVYVTANPAGARPHWRHVRIRGAHELRSISCPTTRFCAAANNRGEVFVSRNPGAMSPKWHGVQVDTAGGSIDFGTEPVRALIDLSCPSRRLCVTVDHGGHVFSSTHPGRGPGAWKEIRLGFDPPGGLACPSSGLCLLPAPNGVVYASRTPAGAASTWIPTSVEPGGEITSVACPSALLCFAGDSNGDVIVGRAAG